MLPIYIIGAGGIVNDAHLPAYQLAGYTVGGIYDRDLDKATQTAERFGIPKVYGSLEEMIREAPASAVYDMALPASAIMQVLHQLPDKATVLIQKPMGDNLADARRILTLTRQKQLLAGINFQLRYAPFIKAARELITSGVIGDLCDMEVNVNVFTPWHLWDFLFQLPRVEILYHSIHYIDLVRSFFGNPAGVFAKTARHPSMPQLASVRSNIIMDYGDWIRAGILTNHCHQFGLHNQHAYVKWEGTKGAIKASLGSLINYPHGVPDTFEFVVLEEGKEPEWKAVPIEGSWFPHAFIGSMEQLMLAAEGKIARPDNSVEDAIYTMECVEQAYRGHE